MLRFIIPVLLLTLLTTGSSQSRAAQPEPAQHTETKYLLFQLMTGLPGYAGPQPLPGHFALSKTQLEDFVQNVAKTIGVKGDARHKLGFSVGPLCFDMSDDETRQFIRDAFAVARENDVAVAFHIDDSISWGQRKDLLSNPDNIETADWKQIPSTGRRADWGFKPTKFPPQMCFNSPAIVAAVKDRAALIGAIMKQEMGTLKSHGQEHLFAGVMAGWETQIGRDFETDRPLGYRALSQRGFSETNPPKDPDRERVLIVKEFMELWANSLHTGGIPRERIFCHIAFTSQGLRAADAKESYAVKVHFALPGVAFSSAYRPGFSTYPEGTTIKEIHAVLAEHGTPGWVSAEGANVSPTSMPGEPTMETYLGKMFNHGALMVNVFSWGIGGEAMRNNFFRRATENPEALAAYAKFLRHAPLIETAPTGFSSEAFQAKMRRIQTELPVWLEKSGQQAQAMPLTQKLQAFIKDKKWQEADKVADAILKLMGTRMPAASQDIPAEARKKLVHDVGGSFLVVRNDKVQEELKLTQEQKEKLEEHLRELLPDAMKFFQKIKDLKPEERKKELRAYRQKEQEKLAAVLKETLNEGQRKRLRQLELQKEGLSGNGEIWKDLQVTDEQRKQFMAEIQQTEKMIGTLMGELQKGGKPDEVRPKVMKLRNELQGKLEALFTDAQKEQWQGMLGKPMDLADLFDL